MMFNRPKAYLSLFALGIACIVSGCIVVDDFGGYWNKGFIDNCVNEIQHNRSKEEHADSKIPPKRALMRSLRIGKHTFLMVRENPDDRGGNMIRYKIESGKYISFRLNESKREEFLQAYPDSKVVLTTETATIPVLDDASVSMLEKIADDDSYWMESSREPYNPARRADCVQAIH
jgi:hypothetical protein